MTTPAKQEERAAPNYLQKAVDHWGQTPVRVLRDTICAHLELSEMGLFLEVSRLKGLDPFSGEIHAVKRWNKKAGKEVMTIQTGINGFRTQAEKSGEYRGQRGPYWWDGKSYKKEFRAVMASDGSIATDKNGEPVVREIDLEDQPLWLEVWPHSDPPFASKVLVIRHGFDEPMVGTALYSEYGPSGGHMWKAIASVMLAKVAESIALRRAFPRQLSGLYSNEEMAQAEDGTQTPESQVSFIQKEQQEKQNADVVDVEVETPKENPIDTSWVKPESSDEKGRWVEEKEEKPKKQPKKKNGNGGATKIMIQYATALDSCESVDQVNETVQAWESKLNKLRRGHEYLRAYEESTMCRVDENAEMDAAKVVLVNAIEEMRDNAKTTSASAA